MMARNPDASHINERRLRPIYDCLDNGNNKKALQEADKVLKKQKDLYCAKVLKALALLRMGRQEESLTNLREVHSEAPTDDSTLQAMTICYRELHKIELIADAYEKAIKKDATNEELHSHLFMAYVRLSDYKKQQMAAMSLYRLKPKNPYYFWAVMSVVMQAITSKDEIIAQKITLPLAEKMCQKFSDENKIEAEAEVELYLLILEKQNKYKEMLNLIESPIGSKLNNHLDFLSKKKADLLRLVDKHEEAFEAYRLLIENNVDQFDYYLQLIEIADILDKKCDKESAEDQKSKSYKFISSVVSFVEDCIQKGLATAADSKPQLQRGPYLAKMILFERLTQRQKTDSDVEHLLKQMVDSVADQLFDYFQAFGSKQAAVYDMFYILDKTSLTADSIQSLTHRIRDSLSIGSKDELSVMYKNLCYHCLCLYTGQYDRLSVADRSALVQKLTEEYQDFYNNIVLKADLTPTEPQPTDPYILLIANILFNAPEIDNRIISQTIVILETALARSGANFHIKLLLIKLYNLLGAVGASHAILETLDIKYIQYDSLGYLFTSPFIAGGHFAASSQLLGNALKFYSANFKDTLDYLISCYKFGSFTKIEEILNLRNRLNNSLQYSLSAVERMISDLILEPKNQSSTENIINYMEIDIERDKFEWTAIGDNRDFSVVRSNHQKSEQLVKERQKQTFDDELLWLKIRNLIIRAIAASYNLVNESPPEKENNHNCGDTEPATNGTEKRSTLSVLTELSDQLKEYIRLTKSSNFAKHVVALEGPNPSRIASFTKANYLDVIASLIEFVVDLHEEPKKQWSVLANCGDTFAKIVADLDESVNKTDGLLTVRPVLEELTNSVETLSISIIFVGICQSIMKNKMNISSNKKTRRKKENTGHADQVVDSLLKTYHSLLTKLKDSALSIENTLKSVKFSDTFSQHFVADDLSENESIVSSVKEKVDKSYNQSISELTELLQNKCEDEKS